MKTAAGTLYKSGPGGGGGVVVGKKSI